MEEYRWGGALFTKQYNIRWVWFDNNYKRCGLRTILQGCVDISSTPLFLS